MVIVWIGLALLAAYLTAGTSLFALGLANAAGSVWGNGVMANFYDDPQAAPDWAAKVSMVTVALSIILILLSLIAS